MVSLTIYTSLIISIVVQVVTAIIDMIALFIKVPSKVLFLKQMLLLEVIGFLKRK